MAGDKISNEYKKITDYWKKRTPSTSAELAEILNGKIVNFAFHSGKIENDHVTYYDTEYIFNNDRVVNYTGDLQTLQEIKNAKNAMEFFLESFEAKTPLDMQFILSLQEIITHDAYDKRRLELGERPGTLKQHDYVVGKEEIGASAKDTEEELSELLEDIHSVDKTNFSSEKVLKMAAYFHAKFEYIHPFADGNGRTGRLCMNYLLVQNNHPPVIIFEEDKYEYYIALSQWNNETQDIQGLYDFLQKELNKTWQRELNLAK